MGRSGAAPLQRAEDKPDSEKWLPYLCCGAVTFFVFFAGAAGAWVVAADFCAGTDWLGRFGLRGAGLVLEIFLVALLLALELARDLGETLGSRFARTSGGAGDRGLRSASSAAWDAGLLRGWP